MAYFRSTAIVFNGDGGDIDFRIASVDNTNIFVMDAGTNRIAMGAGTAANVSLYVAFPTFTASVGGTGSSVYINPAITEAASGTHARMVGVNIDALDLTGAGAATTNAATLRIAGAPAGATSNWALWVDAGASRFDDLIDISNITAGSANFRVTATSDAPSTTWADTAGFLKVSATPAGYVEISVDENPRYIPFWT